MEIIILESGIKDENTPFPLEKTDIQKCLYNIQKV